MSNNHRGNTQPAIDQEEHSHIGGVPGKKTFIMDDSGNQIIDFGGEKLPTSGNNPSTVLSYDGNGDLQYIDETISGTTYRTTLSYTDRVLTSISEAVEQ